MCQMELLKLMEDSDKDKRFMAAHDLNQLIMTRNSFMDLSYEKKVIQAFVKQFEDKSLDVQSNAIRYLSHIVSKIRKESISELILVLCSRIVKPNKNINVEKSSLNSKSSLINTNHAYTACLKSIIAEVEMNLSTLKELTSSMVDGIAPDMTLQIREDCCDILAYISRRYSKQLLLLENVKKRTFFNLDSALRSPNSSVRRKALICFGEIANSLNDVEFKAMMSRLLKEVMQMNSGDLGVTYLLAIEAACRNARSNLKDCTEDILPTLIKIINNCIKKNEETRGKLNDELGNSNSDETKMKSIENTEVLHHILETSLNIVDLFLLKIPASLFQTYREDVHSIIENLISYDSNAYYLSNKITFCVSNQAVENTSENKNVSNISEKLCFDKYKNEKSAETTEEFEYENDSFEEETDFWDDTEDDDTSWKVRTAVLRLLNDEICTCENRERLIVLSEKFTLLLIDRFKDKDFNVKSDVFNTFSQLVCSCCSSSNVVVNCLDKTASLPFSSFFSPFSSSFSSFSFLQTKKKRQKNEVRPHIFIKATPFLIKNIIEEMNIKSYRKSNRNCSSCHFPPANRLNENRANIMHMLCSVSPVLSETLEKHLHKLKDILLFCLSNPNFTIKCNALRLIQIQAKFCVNKDVYISLHKDMLPPIIDLIDNSYYKVSYQALKTISAYIRAIRMQSLDLEIANKIEISLNILTPAFDALNKKLADGDINYDVKQQAVKCFGHFCANLGDIPYYKKNLDECMNSFLGILQIEATRRTALKALKTICSARHRYDLTRFLQEIMNSVRVYICTQNCDIKQLSIEVASDLTKLYPAFFSEIQTVAPILDAASSQVIVNDLYSSNLCLKLISGILQMKNELTADQQKKNFIVERLKINSGYSNILKLTRSPLLQNECLQSVLEFWSIVAKYSSIFPFEEILKDLIDSNAIISSLSHFSSEHAITSSNFPALISLTKNILSNISKCLSVVLFKINDLSLTNTFLHHSLERLNTITVNQPYLIEEQIYILTVGEIGKLMTLSKTFPSLFSILLNLLSFQNEDIRTSTILALGNVTVGSLEDYLKLIIREIEKSERKEKGVYKKYYLLFSVLKHVISLHYFDRKTNDTDIKENLAGYLKPYIPNILKLLYENSVCEEELQFSIISECFGYLILLYKEAVSPLIFQMLSTTAFDDEDLINSSIKQKNLNSQDKSMQENIIDNHYTAMDNMTALDAKAKMVIALNSLRHVAQEKCDISLFDYFKPVFLQCHKKKDIDIRREFLLAINALCTHPDAYKFLQHDVEEILKYIAEDINIKEIYIREVNLVPFKHKIDDAIPLRKTSFQTISIFVKIFKNKINFSIMEIIGKGLQDIEDIQLLCCSILVDLCYSSKNYVLSGVEKICEPLEKLIAKVSKSITMQQNKMNSEGMTFAKASSSCEYEKLHYYLRYYTETLYILNESIKLWHPPQIFIETLQRCLLFEPFQSFWEILTKKSEKSKCY